MDQKCVSGLGNIYVNEILFSSKIKPDKKVKNLKIMKKKIIKNTKKILKKSIKFGGSSIKDFSSDDGKKGMHFNNILRFMGRKGEKCSNTDCNTFIQRLIISNRASFFCKKCQK